MSEGYKVSESEIIKNTGNFIDNACVWISGNNSNIVNFINSGNVFDIIIEMVKEGIKNPTQWYEKNYVEGKYEVQIRTQVTETAWGSVKALIAGVGDDVEPHGRLLAVRLDIYATDYNVGEAYNICDGTYTVVAEQE